MRRSLLAVVPIAVVMGAIETALILALRISKASDSEWPLTLMAVLSACLLAAGVLRHYWDIWVHRAVRGISFIFVGIDAAGDVFSLVSLFFQPKLDVLGVVIYGSEFVLWCGVFACGGYYNLLPWLRERRAAKLSRDNGPLEVDLGLPISDCNQPGQAITLHENQSSTSVFRTASSAPGVRPRTVTSQRSGDSPQD